MSNIDVRWKQRLENFKKAYSELKEAVELSQTRQLSKLEVQGLIQSFEYTHELAWNTLKDYFRDQGTVNITGSKDATRQALIYGSRAIGTFRNGSDIDICLKGKKLSTKTFLKMENQLDDLMLPYTFDICIYHKIDNPNFINHIDRVGIPLVSAC